MEQGWSFGELCATERTIAKFSRIDLAVSIIIGSLIVRHYIILRICRRYWSPGVYGQTRRTDPL